MLTLQLYGFRNTDLEGEKDTRVISSSILNKMASLGVIFFSPGGDRRIRDVSKMLSSDGDILVPLKVSHPLLAFDAAEQLPAALRQPMLTLITPGPVLSLSMYRGADPKILNEIANALLKFAIMLLGAFQVDYGILDFLRGLGPKWSDIELHRVSKIYWCNIFHFSYLECLSDQRFTGMPNCIKDTSLKDYYLQIATPCISDWINQVPVELVSYVKNEIPDISFHRNSRSRKS